MDRVMDENFFERAANSVKEFFSQFSLDEWLNKMLSTQAGTATLAFGSAFLLGFIFRKYFRCLFIWVLFTVAFIFLMRHYNVVFIDWIRAQTLVGFDITQVDIDNIFASIWQWAKTHGVIVFALVAGFLLGYKLG